MEKNSTIMRGNLVRLNISAANRLRLRQGLLKCDLASRAGVNVVSTSRALNGRPVGVKAARAIAAALGTTLDLLMLDDECVSAGETGARRGSVADMRVATPSASAPVGADLAEHVGGSLAAVG